jgi:glucose uptake protein GlcU
LLFFYKKPGFDEGLGAFIFGNPPILGMLVLVYFLIGAVLAIWSYKNAKKRKMKYKAWLVAILFSGFIGFLVYMTIRDPFVSE